ncbi:MAG TPA: hypothetical protein PKA63_10010 [Oligoflexia bacterium]|nr:hypothetical protein [Oligoflexia bacterium]HMP48990.1 hypothetical protein [Oligoflexia bacterium]
MDDPCCHACGRSLGLSRGMKIGRGETCAHCNVDVRVCKNCVHYNEKVYNECKETQAERVLEKATANFCDFFVLVGGKSSSPENSGKSEKDLAKERFEALFKS